MQSLHNLFLAKLPRILTDADLLQLFTEHDHHPVSAKVMLDAVSGKSKGFGFVLFDTEEQGRAAYEALNKMHVTVRGHNFALCISPSKHNGKAATEESNTLYIRNIPDTLKREEVERFLSKFGTLMHLIMRPDHYGNPVWVVSAVYESIDGARNALAKLHGNRTYFSGVPPIMAKFRDTTEAKLERRRRRQEQSAFAEEQFREGVSSPPGHFYTTQNSSFAGCTGTGSNMSLYGNSVNGASFHDEKHSFGSTFSRCSMSSASSCNHQVPTGNACEANSYKTYHISDECPVASRETPVSTAIASDQLYDCNAAATCPPGVYNLGNLNPTTYLPPTTPERRSSTLSTGSYRHNPYAPVTPMSSAKSSAGPNSPRSSCHQTVVNMHFNPGNNQHAYLRSNGCTRMAALPNSATGFANHHFTNRDCAQTTPATFAAAQSVNDI